jgi:hypothetical protein
MKSLLILAVVFLSLPSCTKDDVRQTPGPQIPSCGFIQDLTDELIAGMQFSKGKYQINVFNITCEEVMGDKGLFSQFLQLGDNVLLPAPWIHLKDAVGAPKFVKSTSTNVGFRAQRVGD